MPIFGPMRRYLVYASAACALVLFSLGTGTSFASSVATTGQPTSITSTTVTLNGVASPTDADSGWMFQYGTSSAYDHTTGLKPISAGVHAVSVTLTGLHPSTTYHYRLVVAQGSYNPTFDTGNDMTFTTAAAGGGGGGGAGAAKPKASLGTHNFKVKGSKVSIPLKCTGPSGTRCKGKYSLTARAKLHGRKVTCGSGSFNFPAGKTSTLTARVGGACSTLLSTGNHRRGAILKVIFSTAQSAINTGVTLIRG